MKKQFLLFLTISFLQLPLLAQVKLDSLMPVRGICMGAPAPGQLKDFIKFVSGDLAANHVNTLILRIDYNYQYQSYPLLRGDQPLSNDEVKQIVKVARANHIRLIPQINLLGHQSWASQTGKLLEQFPQFDETPWVKMPEKYEWPNQDGLYCKSYCPLHPDVHQVVFALIDEITEAFEADAFHAGMDEVFYIGEDQCPRCQGKDKAELFAGEVRKIRDHLDNTGKELWIWGDRLLDGSSTGLGMWEASMNHTHRAIDMIPKDVFICDWHYEKAEPTASYFALKGFRVATCPWRTPSVAMEQVDQLILLRRGSNQVTGSRFMGMIQTIWNDTGNFLDTWNGKDKNPDGSVECTKALFERFRSLVK